jgi:hypothetical protein
MPQNRQNKSQNRKIRGMDALHALELEKGVHKYLAARSDASRQKLADSYVSLLHAYPDCPAKQLMLKAFERCPRDNVLAFMAITRIALLERVAFTGEITRALKDEHGQPIFYSLCDELTPGAQQVNAWEQANLHTRRSMMRMSAGAIFGFLALKEVNDGNWTKESPTGEGRVDAAKIGRLLTEIFGTAAAIHFADKDLQARNIATVIGSLSPFLEKELAKERGGMGR